MWAYSPALPFPTMCVTPDSSLTYLASRGLNVCEVLSTVPSTQQVHDKSSMLYDEGNQL